MREERNDGWDFKEETDVEEETEEEENEAEDFGESMGVEDAGEEVDGSVEGVKDFLSFKIRCTCSCTWAVETPFCRMSERAWPYPSIS